MNRSPLLLHKQVLGIVVFIVLIATMEVILHLMPRPSAEEEVYVPDSIATGKPRYVYHRDTVVLQLQPFDPNTADSLTLLQVGLRPWQIRNMQKYRAKNGRYRIKQDFRRLYGLTDSMYLALEPFLLLPDTLPRRDSIHSDTLRRDTSRTFYVHEKRDTIIELNSADTSSLQYVRGIGKYTAVQIVRYRARLGGFVSVEQLREIEGLDYVVWDSVMPHLWADAEHIERLRVNTMSVERLQRHPYMSFEQAKAVYTLRRKRIRLNGIEDLRELPFTEEQLTRLAPYLDFKSEMK